MSIDTTHPELEREQRYVEHAYRCIEFMLEEVSGLAVRGRNDFEKAAFEHWKATRVAALSDTTSALVFGRTDAEDGETNYIGRHHVRDGSYDVVVTDWRAPVAKAFYQANARDPMGLRRRRQFLVDGRELLGISDDDLRTEGLRGTEILHEELRRQRSGTMRDIVATIQAEQDVIIRAPLEGVVVVQGGPGTGKTAIGLHRAAYLLYEHRRRLQRMGVLVVGPNPVFIQYVSQVLPSLGESAVVQVAVDDLAPHARVRAEDPPDVVRVKGDVRMSEVVRRALEQRCRPLEADVELAYSGIRFVLPVAAVHAEAETLRQRRVAFREGREALRDKLLVAAYNAYADTRTDGSAPEAFSDVVAALRNDTAFKAALDRVWPAVSAARLVGDLYASPTRLSAAADGLLSKPEQRLLRRKRGGRKAEEAWTSADRPILDEARALIEGPPDRYGHVIVDEAQDLSPMQLRVIGRRCPQGSATVLGDLGQATGVWAHDHWDEVLEHLPRPDGAQVEELTLGYRVASSIMGVAAAILREAAPALKPPASVRREPGEVVVTRAGVAERGKTVASAAATLLADGGAVAIIAAESLLEETRTALARAGVGFGEAERRDLTQPLTLVPVRQAKGLEFDVVVLVEPGAVVAEGGLRLLYVAVTRAMRDLVVVHADELPAAMVRAKPVAV